MLRQIFVIKGKKIIYKRCFGSALSDSEIEKFSLDILKEANENFYKKADNFKFFNYRISYEVELKRNLCFIFTTGLIDDYMRNIKPQLIIFKYEFLSLLNIETNEIDFNSPESERLDLIADRIHRLLRPKIAIVGFAGVGKTTIKKLIKLEEIPKTYTPTISGDIATIKIGELLFSLWDFAGQEQYRYLWKNYIKGSDAVLIVTDSTSKNIKESRFFLELIKKEVPYTRSAIIGNKQDLEGAINFAEIEKTMGLKTYSMIANRPKNREKMIEIISEIFELEHEAKPLVKALTEEKQFFEQVISIEEKEIIEEESILTEEPEVITSSSNELEVNKGEPYIDTLVEESQLIEDPTIIEEKKIIEEESIHTKEPELLTSLSNELKSFKGESFLDTLVEESQLIEEPTIIEEKVTIEEESIPIKESELLTTSPNKIDSYYDSKRQKLKDEIKNLIHKDLLLKFIKGKKKIQINYLERALKINKEKILGYLFELIKNGYIECEFNEDNSEFYITT